MEERGDIFTVFPSSNKFDCAIPECERSCPKFLPIVVEKATFGVGNGRFSQKISSIAAE
jgi:hypothetical protein